MTESVHTVPLRNINRKPQKKRARAAIQEIKKYLKKHTRKDKATISEEINKKIWEKGGKPPKKIKIKIETEEDKAIATLPEE